MEKRINIEPDGLRLKLKDRFTKTFIDSLIEQNSVGFNDLDLDGFLDDLEKNILSLTYLHARKVKETASKMLHLGRTTIVYKFKKHNI